MRGHIVKRSKGSSTNVLNLGMDRRGLRDHRAQPRHPRGGALQIAKLQPSDVERMEAALLRTGLTADTVHQVHVVLAKALKDAIREAMVHRNVFRPWTRRSQAGTR